MAAHELIFVCRSERVVEGGDGVRFDVDFGGRSATAFVVRWHGELRAYLNQCTHVAMELDWQPGRFFDIERTMLMCATHGALYDPAGGACIGGPCRGRGGLRRVVVVERDGEVWWQPDDAIGAPIRQPTDPLPPEP